MATLLYAVISQGFGCMSLTPGFFGSKGIDPEESERTLRRALDLGVTVLNTADFYGCGSNIELIGEYTNLSHRSTCDAPE